jgi:hypothetical protein
VSGTATRERSASGSLGDGCLNKDACDDHDYDDGDDDDDVPLLAKIGSKPRPGVVSSAELPPGGGLFRHQYAARLVLALRTNMVWRLFCVTQ